MSYGSPEWQKWVLPEEQAIEHIKFACVCTDPTDIWNLKPKFRYEAGINTFDTANVRVMKLNLLETLTYSFTRRTRMVYLKLS